jgi:hypothetical protein
MTIRALALLALLAPNAGAQTRPAGASQEFFVEGSGGGYEVLVSPTFVTVFYLPEPVTRAFGSNQKDFRIDVLRDTVVVRPVKNDPGLTANLGIQTRKLKINVVLKIASETEQALSQVIFTRAEQKAEIDKKVAEALEPLRAELEAKNRQLDELVRRRAQDEIAEAMLRDYELFRMAGVARNDDNVVLRVPRAIRMGEDRYIYFTLQNRGAAAFLLHAATVRQDGKDLAARAVFAPRADGALGKVDPGQRGAGVLVVPAGQLRPGRAIDLLVQDGKRSGQLRVDGLRIP